MEWISVNNRLPEEDLKPGEKKERIKVLVGRVGNKASVRTATRLYDKERKQWYWSDQLAFSHITHWMLLPKPPKEE